MMRCCQLVAVALGVVVSMAAPARADILIVSSSFNAAPTDVFGLTLFDPSLGTLDAVHVGMTGTVAVSGTTAPNLVPVPPAGLVPAPYTFRVDVEQRFEGIAGGLFSFGSPATFIHVDQATGAPGGFGFAVPFTYGFTFNDISDLIGFTLGTFSGPTIPPVPVIGTRSDFIDGLGVSNLLQLTHLATPVPVTGPPPTITSVSSSGVVQLQYVYTPAAVVPEPASLSLLAVAAAACVRRLHRRRRATDRLGLRRPTRRPQL